MSLNSLAVATDGYISTGTGGGTVIVGGDRSANIALALSTSISQALSAGLSLTQLTTDKPLSLSANINHRLEATICQ